MKQNLLLKMGILSVLLLIPFFLLAQSGQDMTQEKKTGNIENQLSYQSNYAFKNTASTIPHYSTQRKSNDIWSNTFDDPNDWIESNSSSTPGGIWVITDVFPQVLISQGFGPEFNSTVGGNFAFINSDEEGQTGSQLANLTTANPIDLSEYEDVLLEFENYFRRFMETHRVGISLDGVNWEYITVNTVPVNTTSSNPEVTRVDISDFAGGQSEVWLRFQYQGQWDWFWCIDNVRITELPEVSTGIFNPYNPSHSFATPIRHYAGTEIPFGLNVQNFGKPVDSVFVTVEVANMDTEEILYNDQLIIEFLPRSADSFIVFDNNYIPELGQLNVGTYSVNYTVETPGRPDFDPSDNSHSFVFTLTESLYALEDPSINTFANSIRRTDPTWYWGSAYYISPQPEEDAIPRFLGSSHAFRVEGGEYTDEIALVYLLEYVAEGGPSYTFGEFIGADVETPPDIHPAFTQIAVAIIDTELLNSVGQGEVFHIPVNSYLNPLDLSPFEDPIHLKQDKLYFLVTQIEQSGQESTLRIAFNPNINYDGRVNNVILFTNGRNFTGFTDAQAPVVRMHTDVVTSTNDFIESVGLNTKIYPNPVIDDLNIELNPTVTGEVKVELFDMKGSLVGTSKYSHHPGGKITKDIRAFQTGNYIVRITSDKVVESIKIFILK